jgi:predicted DNA-binding WGR domain protein
MNTLRLRLEARAPALRCNRAYEITVGQDLFGIWIAELTYGRIGAIGRTKTRSFTRIEDAAAAVDASLRRRATLPRRLGVAYRLCRVEFEAVWPKVDLSERLISFTNAGTGSVPDLP